MHLVVPAGGLGYAVNLFRHWSFSLYYIVSELWGSAGVPLLFWTCANDIVKIDQAKRIYPLISLIGNLGPILSGTTMAAVSKFVKRSHSNDEQAFEVSLKILNALATVAGGVVAGLHWYVHRLNRMERNLAPVMDAGKPHGKKPKLTLIESVRVLAKDKYLRNIAIMVISYGLSIEFTEIIWKATVKKAFPGKSEYLAFMGK
jgi:AAA family ATP:ADP antiporter